MSSDADDLPGCREHDTEWCERCKDYCFCPGQCPNLPKEAQPRGK